MYPLHAHDIKCNANQLKPNQVTFCLAVMKKYILSLRSLILVDLHQIKCFIFIQTRKLKSGLTFEKMYRRTLEHCLNANLCRKCKIFSM